jgi:hypothetical protein
MDMFSQELPGPSPGLRRAVVRAWIGELLG